MQEEEVFDITDTAVLVLEMVMWCGSTGHTVPLNVTQTPQPTAGGLGNCPLWGELGVSFGPQ